MTKNKIWKLVISCVVAIGLWVYVVTVVSPGSVETYNDVPVNKRNFTGLSEEFVITQCDESIDVRLEGNRIDLNALDAGSIIIEADLSAIQKAGTYHINYTAVPTGNFASNAFVVQKIEPEKLTIKVEKLLTKTVPVVYELNGTVADNYIVYETELEMDYTEVEIKGPESLINQVHYAVITIDVNNRTQTIDADFSYELCDKNQKRVNVKDPALIEALTTDVVHVKLPVYLTKQLELKVELIPGGGVTSENCSYVIKPAGEAAAETPVKLLVAGPEEILSKMDTLVIDTVKLEELMVDEVRTVSIGDRLEKLGLKNMSGSEIDEYSIELKLTGLKTETFDIIPKNIKVNNPDYQLNTTNPVVKVKVRGREELVNKLTEKDIVVILEGTETGTTIVVTPKVQFSDEFNELGVLEITPQSFTLTKKS